MRILYPLLATSYTHLCEQLVKPFSPFSLKPSHTFRFGEIIFPDLIFAPHEVREANIFFFSQKIKKQYENVHSSKCQRNVINRIFNRETITASYNKKQICQCYWRKLYCIFVRDRILNFTIEQITVAEQMITDKQWKKSWNKDNGSILTIKHILHTILVGFVN